jgi:hypothetical protein
MAQLNDETITENQGVIAIFGLLLFVLALLQTFTFSVHPLLASWRVIAIFLTGLIVAGFSFSKVR